MKILEWNKQEFIFIYNKCDASSNGSNNQSICCLICFYLFMYLAGKQNWKNIELFIEFHEQKSNLCHYVKLNHDAMIVVSKNKERKNVENCSRQKYRKVETFFGKKKDNKSIIHIRHKYNSMKFSFIRMNN